MTDFIYHITDRNSWFSSKETGEYRAVSLEKEGFIHCSKAKQILRVANHFYNGQHGLVILMIDPSRVGNEIHWEPGTDKADELFPHIYGPLKVDAVIRVFNFEPGAGGLFSLPGDLAC